MERICDGIYINNSERVLIKFDENGENLFLQGDLDFVNIANAQISTYHDYNYTEKILSIMPNTATKAEFILSNKCNMGCIYCYSSINRNTNTLSFKQASAVIDRLVANSVIKNLKLGRARKIYLSFHGGGEPSCEIDLLKNIVEYAKNTTSKNHTRLYLEITTNLSQENDYILDFYLDNDFFIHISMDGIENVQNHQRPYADGSNSFSTVARNISYLSKRNALFSIRLTVTNYSVAYAVESVKYLRKMFPNIRFIKLAPLETSEESQQNAIKPPQLADYIKIMEEIDSLSWNEDSQYLSVFGEADTIVNSGMCASVRFEQIIISPEGIITTCHEDPLSEYFSFGKVSKEGIIEIDTEKVHTLKKERCENIISGKCSKCAFRLLCMGGCKHRMLTKDRNMFCAIEKYTLTKHIKKIFSDTRINDIGLECKRVEYSVNGNKGFMEIISLGGVQ
jgi:uncharacterized protein